MITEKMREEQAKARDLSSKTELTPAEMNRRMSSTESRFTKLPQGYCFSNITTLGGAPQRWVIIRR